MAAAEPLAPQLPSLLLPPPLQLPLPLPLSPPTAIAPPRAPCRVDTVTFSTPDDETSLASVREELAVVLRLAASALASSCFLIARRILLMSDVRCFLESNTRFLTRGPEVAERRQGERGQGTEEGDSVGR